MASRVVTPEAVLLELPTAGPAVRALARCTDLIVNGFVVSSISSVLIMFVGVSGGFVVGPVAVAASAVFAYLILIPIGIEVVWRGRSIGKAIFGLKVVGVDGSRETPRQAMVRGVVALADVFVSLGVLAMASSMFSEKSQRLGDLAAGTVVIRSQTSRSAYVPIAFHPPVGWEHYVRSMPVGGLRDEDLVLVRDFLLRTREFTPETRWTLAAMLAGAIQARIRTAVPANVHPETWLICVASAYQMREGGLLADAAAGLAPLAPVMSPPRRERARRWR